MAEKTGLPSEDWELSEDFYREAEQKELSLEDFITEGDLQPEARPFASPEDDRLKKTIEDVHKVLTLGEAGKSIEQIVQMTGFDWQYIHDIQVCAQGFREDDEIAVAHLVLG